MTLRSAFLRFAAAASAVAIVSFAGSSARAFTFENQNATNADGSSKFADPDDQVKTFGNNGMQLGPGGPFLQFGGGSVSHFGPSSAFGAPPPRPPEPYSNGNND